jgi:hypothetical protein
VSISWGARSELIEVKSHSDPATDVSSALNDKIDYLTTPATEVMPQWLRGRLQGMTTFDPFDIFDTEAERLDRFFSSLDAAGWERPSRCAGWSVRDVLGHLAGEELYSHACLNGTLSELIETLGRESVDISGFNEWCVRQRRAGPHGDDCGKA